MEDDTYDDVSAGHAEGSGRARGWLRRLTPRRAELITDKRRSPAEDLRHRERVYKVLQFSRIPFLGLALVTFLWWDNWIISALLFVISVPMPWIAVMFANAQGEPRDRRAPRVYKPGVVRHMETERQLAEARQAEIETARAAETIDDPGDGGDPSTTGTGGSNTVDEQVDPDVTDGPRNGDADQAGDNRP